MSKYMTFKNVKTNFENMRVQKFFSKNNKTKHLQLYLFQLDGKIIEY